MPDDLFPEPMTPIIAASEGFDPEKDKTVTKALKARMTKHQMPENQMTKRRVYIKTYGCQMNVYDSDQVISSLKPLGYETVLDPGGADLVLLNTCHIREKASEKLYSDLGRLRNLKQERGADHPMRIAVLGCVAQAEGEEILNRVAAVDLVLGPQSLQKLPELLQKLDHNPHLKKEERFFADFAAPEKFSALSWKPGQNPEPVDILTPVSQTLSRLKTPEFKHSVRRQNPTAFLTIQEGCDKFCSFCVVPYTRGAEYSRPVADILTEARGLIAEGVREITLLGQNVNAYCGAMPQTSQNPQSLARLSDLIRLLSDLPDLWRIRYTTSHPKDMTDDLITAHGEMPKLMPFLHLPIQSGSDRILKAMNRKHDVAFYDDLVTRLRLARPDIALSSDFIIGYPGETEDDFAKTLDLVNRIGFAGAFSFKYSPRPGTKSEAEKDQVPDHVMSERLARLNRVLDSQRLAFQTSLIGKTIPVLLERRGRYDNQWIGKSPWLQSVWIEQKDNRLGERLEVLITASGPNSLSGQVV